jgi:hypothetical protein
MFWILGVLSLAAALIAFVRSSQRDDATDLGSVSRQWLVEYRQSQES